MALSENSKANALSAANAARAGRSAEGSAEYNRHIALDEAANQ
jgi:hypothetical protein